MNSIKHPLLIALALAIGSAIALGFARFSYGLLLPIMKNDLGWNYLIAGTMNTANALGYLIGALLMPWLMRRMSVNQVFWYACLVTALFLFLSGQTYSAYVLFLYRVIAGIASALIFIAGGVLAAKLGSLHEKQSGWMLGIYYAGPGFGILLCSIVLPFVHYYSSSAHVEHGWQWSWYVLGAICFLLSWLIRTSAFCLDANSPKPAGHISVPLKQYALMLLAYFMFGVGYIGYMTFVVALLKQMGIDEYLVHVFYGMLGLAVMASSKIWAKMLDRFRGGQSLAILNTLLGLASILPAWLASVDVKLTQASLLGIFASGLVFGSVFLSAVASTTAFVKHNMKPVDWVGGITAFTSIFAIGQVVGPTIVGWVSDSSGGLVMGLYLSGIALLIGGFIAFWQKPLH